MFRQGIRRFGTTALRAAEGSTAYAVRVSQAQGIVNGLTEGMRFVLRKAEQNVVYGILTAMPVKESETPPLSA